MPDELVDQLRRYGEAVERAAFDAAYDTAQVAPARPWRHRHRRVLAVAAACVVLAVGGWVVATVIGDERATVVHSTRHGRKPRPGPSVTTPDRSHAPAPSSTATTAGPTPSSAPNLAPVTTVIGSSSPLTPATTNAPPATATPVSPTTAPVVANAARGRASWNGSHDPRGFLDVAACPTSDTSTGCPSMRTASVAPDGSFTLPLPAGSGEWRVAAYVGVATNRGCIFQCQWRQTQLGPSTTVSAARPPQNLQLSVSARVIGVVVRDRDGNPFPDAGMMVFDQRCPSNCDGTDLAGMFMGAHDDLGDITVVVDPSVTYSFGGYAANQGWPKPYVQNGTEMWFSDSVVVAGSDLDEGTIFRINGGPNG